MGLICGCKIPQEETYYDNTLATINESLCEQGMPKFNPPVPINHKEVFVEQLKSGDGNQPNSSSTVEIEYSGWICEEGDLWRELSGVDIRRLTTPLKSLKSFLEPLAKCNTGNSETALSPAKNASGLSVTKTNSGSRGKSLNASSSDRHLKIISHQNSESYSEKTTLYGRCYEHTDCWEIELGAGEVVDGLEEVILGMSVGDEVIAFIPSNLAFGDQGSGQVVPSKADLVVQVTLRNIIL